MAFFQYHAADQAGKNIEGVGESREKKDRRVLD
jgi:hypothetical protein